MFPPAFLVRFFLQVAASGRGPPVCAAACGVGGVAYLACPQASGGQTLAWLVATMSPASGPPGCLRGEAAGEQGGDRSAPAWWWGIPVASHRLCCEARDNLFSLSLRTPELGPWVDLSARRKSAQDERASSHRWQFTAPRPPPEAGTHVGTSGWLTVGLALRSVNRRRALSPHSG